MNDKKNREPMVIALATGKGGSMKTTSAVFLACALVDQSRGEQHVLVADADVQGDAKDWWYRAAELDDPLPFDVMSAAPADIAHLHGINDRLDDPVDWVLIDSAPYGRALDESVNNADLVVIPSSPSRIDLDQAVGVKDLCDRRGVPAAILLCRTEANTTVFCQVGVGRFGVSFSPWGVVTFCWTSLSVWSLVSVPDGFRRRAQAGCVCP